MNVAVSAVSGLYDDSWSERVFQCCVRSDSDIMGCALSLWLKPEFGRTQSTIEISVNGGAAAKYSVRHDVPTLLHVPFVARAGTEATLRITCDNDVSDTGADVRPLSFKLNAVRFS
jgi:hypothetical protein